ncbi:nucleoside phosphorylase domain-containing protein [Fusarium austroafricanum]|uniref:Nucleoside phosphorylase domain-containing protein n=1 Tax=Fusarium austroafricanum TaxID=2364996 RepID=A0A8H4NW26_9HYPO|nr:nucleoside phosphorylase domain-containing protein [Fusarium austroafricanum]
MSNPPKYTVGWICAITTEYLAAQLFLDEEHEGPEFVSANDSNNYTLGKIGKHNVVIAVHPHGEYGISSAADVAKDMLHSFTNVRFGLMVGIGGGAPTPEHDIRLGDVVVSASGHGKGGVLQYDFGKAVQDQEFQETRFLNQPPIILRTAVHGLLTQYKRKGHQLDRYIDDILVENPRLKKEFQRPESSTDRLYYSSKVHPPDDQSSCAKACGDDPLTVVIPPSKVEAEKPISEVLNSRCGKTILSTTILDHLLQIDTYTTLAFFFDFSDPGKQKLENLLRSLAIQLYHTGNEAARRLDSLFASHDDGRKQPDTNALPACVDAMIHITGKVVVIIDALDECTTREDLLHWLRSLACSNAQLIVTGRPEAAFRREIPRSFDERNCILLDKKAVNADIRSYVNATLQQKPDFVY